MPLAATLAWLIILGGMGECSRAKPSGKLMAPSLLTLGLTTQTSPLRFLRLSSCCTNLSHSTTTQVNRASVAIGVQGSSVTPAVKAARLAQQMPPIPNFSEDSIAKDSDTFVDWSEQFQLVTEACQWSDQVKLVNLAIRLKGQAYAFYWSCSPVQRASYPALMEALLHRFTPVTIRSVQTSQFHERKQGTSGSVDSFAQELRRLFWKAHPEGAKKLKRWGKLYLHHSLSQDSRRI